MDAHAQRRLLDRPAVLIGGHRTDEHVVGTEERSQRGILRTPAVEVRTDRDDDRDPTGSGSFAASASAPRNPDRSASSGQTVKTSSNWSTTTSTCVPAGMSRERSRAVIVPGAFAVPSDCAERPGQLAHRVLAGPHHRDGPAVAPREHSAADRRDQPGTDG